MIDELGATKFAEIYSPTFPPQVLVKEEGIIGNMINELYYLKEVGEDNLDLIILVGNTQALTPEGQYLMCKDILDYVGKFDINRIFTLGGMATGQPVEIPKVLGAATHEEDIELLKEADIEIRSNDLMEYDNSISDYLLLDSGKGSGRTFDWNLIRNDLNKDFFLAGGINISNISKAISEFKPYAIDLSSGVETDGFKDEFKIKEIMEVIR